MLYGSSDLSLQDRETLPTYQPSFHQPPTDKKYHSGGVSSTVQYSAVGWQHSTVVAALHFPMRYFQVHGVHSVQYSAQCIEVQWTVRHNTVGVHCKVVYSVMLCMSLNPNLTAARTLTIHPHTYTPVQGYYPPPPPTAHCSLLDKILQTLLVILQYLRQKTLNTQHSAVQFRVVLRGSMTCQANPACYIFANWCKN